MSYCDVYMPFIMSSKRKLLLVFNHNTLFQCIYAKKWTSKQTGRSIARPFQRWRAAKGDNQKHWSCIDLLTCICAECLSIGKQMVHSELLQKRNWQSLACYFLITYNENSDTVVPVLTASKNIIIYI